MLTAADHARAALVRRTGRHALPPDRPAAADPAALARHASDARGELVLDAGAVRAVTERNASLLPAGITAVDRAVRGRRAGRSGRPGRAVVARGLVNYDADELPALLGRTTRELSAELGAGYDRTVVHRDALVVIERADLTGSGLRRVDCAITTVGAFSMLLG